MLSALLGALVRNGSVKMTRSLSQLRLPTTIQGILAARIDRLASEHKELLQTLAVIGRESPLGLTRRMVNVAEPRLERMLSELQAGEFVYEQPAIPEPQYMFKHALTQEVAYNSLLIERRKLLHRRVAQALESTFDNRLDEHLTELAHHYNRSGDVTKALHYLHSAAEQAIRRSANAEAIIHLKTGLQLLEILPTSTERLRQEITLQTTLAVPIMITEGPASTQVQNAYRRARELCEEIANTQRLAPVLWGIQHLSRLLQCSKPGKLRKK
jgi:predicted ATPase